MKKIQLFNIPHGRLAVRKRSLIQWLVLLVSVWSFLIDPVGQLSGLLGYLKYLPDGILLVLLVLALGRSRFTVQRKLLTPLRIVVGFFLYVLVVYLFRYQSVAYFLWGFRNLFRFWIAFFAFIAFLDEADAQTWFKMMEILFWVNVVLSVFQFVVLGAKGDYLGGIFGIDGGSNGYTMLFLAIMVSKSLLSAFNGTEKFWISMLKCGVSLVLAAMAEMKFYYFVFIFLLLGASMITRFSGKKVALLLLGTVTIMLGASLLTLWFDSGDFLSWESLWEQATKENYSSRGDVNRLSAIPSLAETVVRKPIDQIFGLGLGNCDTSSFAVCNTLFFQRYGHLHYTWFTSAMVFLEMGYLGLGIYILFYMACFLHAYKQYKANVGNRLNNQLVVLMATLCVIIMFYNSTLRIEAGYMMFFVLALPFFKQTTETSGTGSQRENNKVSLGENKKL